MPVIASRFTLIVEGARRCAATDVRDFEALGAGVIVDGDGFGLAGYPFMRPFETPLEALLYRLAIEDKVDPDRCEVEVISFLCISRNISTIALDARGHANV